MSEIGVLEWFEDHHIPVDVIAGTSMGCMLSALYSSGKTIDQLKAVMNDQVFSSVFSLGTSYKALNYRRREDGRALPNAITVGLKHGVSFRNSVLVDQGLNAFLDRQFLAYNDETDFNSLPIPLRCIATDLTEADFVDLRARLYTRRRSRQRLDPRRLSPVSHRRPRVRRWRCPR